MTTFTSTLGFFASVNIFLQVTGKIEPRFQDWLTGITWENATRKCGEHGLQHDFEILDDKTYIPNGVEFWIGMAIYRVFTPWIEVIGCYEVTQNIEEGVFTSIAKCKRSCGTAEYIGYKVNTFKDAKEITKHCVCLGNSQPGGRRRRLDKCKQEEGHAFLIYKELRDGFKSSDSSKQGNCITLCCGYCIDREEKEQTDCNIESPLIAAKCGSRNTLLWGLSYSASMDKCYERNKLLIKPTFCQSSTSDRGINLWSNVFRDETEEQLTQDEGHNLSRVQCLTGIIHEHEGGRKLSTTERNCSSKIEGFVCKLSDTDYYPTEQVSTSTKLHTKTTDGTTTHEFIEYVSTSSTMQTKVTEDTTTLSVTKAAQTDLISTSAAQSSTLNGYTAEQIAADRVSVGIVAGTTIAAIGCLILAAVLVVCRLRYVGVFKNTNRKHEDLSRIELKRRHSPNEIESIDGTDNNAYDVVASDFHYNYAVVKKKLNMGVPTITSDDTYVESSYGEYDRLNVTNKRKVNSNENTYDSNAGIKNMADPTYDTSNFNDERYRESDVYDHSFQSGN